MKKQERNILPDVKKMVAKEGTFTMEEKNIGVKVREMNEKNGTLLKAFTYVCNGKEYMIEKWHIYEYDLFAFQVLDGEGKDVEETEGKEVCKQLEKELHKYNTWE